MWGENTNGLSSTGLLRHTDRSSAIRRNYIYVYIYDISIPFHGKISGFKKILGIKKLSRILLSKQNKLLHAKMVL